MPSRAAPRPSRARIQWRPATIPCLRHGSERRESHTEPHLLTPDARALLGWSFGTPRPGETIPDERIAFWFGGTPEIDAACRTRFGALLEQACPGALDAWAATPRGRLALVILLDQLSRNVFRGTPRAFAQDARALQLVREALDLGEDARLAPVERTFLYLPSLRKSLT